MQKKIIGYKLESDSSSDGIHFVVTSVLPISRLTFLCVGRVKASGHPL